MRPVVCFTVVIAFVVGLSSLTSTAQTHVMAPSSAEITGCGGALVVPQAANARFAIKSLTAVNDGAFILDPTADENSVFFQFRAPVRFPAGVRVAEFALFPPQTDPVTFITNPCGNETDALGKFVLTMGNPGGIGPMHLSVDYAPSDTYTIRFVDGADNEIGKETFCCTDGATIMSLSPVDSTKRHTISTRYQYIAGRDSEQLTFSVRLAAPTTATMLGTGTDFFNTRKFSITLRSGVNNAQPYPASMMRIRAKQLDSTGRIILVQPITVTSH